MTNDPKQTNIKFRSQLQQRITRHKKLTGKSVQFICEQAVSRYLDQEEAGALVTAPLLPANSGFLLIARSFVEQSPPEAQEAIEALMCNVIDLFRASRRKL